MGDAPGCTACVSKGRDINTAMDLSEPRGLWLEQGSAKSARFERSRASGRSGSSANTTKHQKALVLIGRESAADPGEREHMRHAGWRVLRAIPSCDDGEYTGRCVTIGVDKHGNVLAAEEDWKNQRASYSSFERKRKDGASQSASSGDQRKSTGAGSNDKVQLNDGTQGGCSEMRSKSAQTFRWSKLERYAPPRSVFRPSRKMASSIWGSRATRWTRATTISQSTQHCRGRSMWSRRSRLRKARYGDSRQHPTGKGRARRCAASAWHPHCAANSEQFG